MGHIINKERLSEADKQKEDFQWFKERLDQLDRYSLNTYDSHLAVRSESSYKRKKVNYDLVNNIMDLKDLEYVYKPYGDGVGELPANMINRDIISPRLKVLHGMELTRPFDWRVYAINPEATTRKEEEQFGRIKQWVISQVMAPIQETVQKQAMEQQQGGELTGEQQKQLKAQIAQQIEAATPDKVLHYMKRKHQDPVEMMASQLLEMTIHQQRMRHKFNKGWVHATTSAEEVYLVTTVNGKAEAYSINSLYFDYDRTPDLDFIEDTDWGRSEMFLPPSQLIRLFELDDDEIDEVYQAASSYGSPDMQFTFTEDHSTEGTIRVLHGNWKSLYRIGFLDFIDPQTGQPDSMIVSGDYQFDEKNGDIDIKWDWIPRSYEGYKICVNNGIYKNMQLVPDQYWDEEDPWTCKLSYYGGSYDDLNSDPTSPVDRMKPSQYLYNITMYRIELLMASDKGKQLFMNMNAIPKSLGIDLEKFLYYKDALKTGFLNPNEEGNRGQDITQMVKEIDLSLASDIQKYIEFAEYIEKKAGDAIGVTENMIGQIERGEAVRNVRQNISQSTHVLEPYFEFHNTIKQNVMQAMLDLNIRIHSKMPAQTLSYVLDDLSLAVLTTNPEELLLAKVGVYVANSASAAQAREEIKQLGHAAMQNQMIDFADIIKVYRSESLLDVEEHLEVATEKKQKQLMASEQAKIEAEAERDAREHAQDMEKLEHERETKIIIEDKKNEAREKEQAMLSVGFNENKDVDDDGKLDVMEIYREGKRAEIEARKQNLEEMKFVTESSQKDRELDIKDRESKQKATTKTA